jgi:hemolysin activation/secretion protein
LNLHPLLALAGLTLLGAGHPQEAQAQAGGGNPLDTLPALPPADIGPGRAAQPLAPSPGTAPQVMDLRVTPARYDIEGVRALPFGEVSSRFAPLVGREVTVSQMVELTRGVTQLYQDRGYVLSYAYVPTQDFRNGVVRIVVVEGHVGEVHIDGDAGNAEAKIREIAGRIQADKPLQRATFLSVMWAFWANFPAFGCRHLPCRRAPRTARPA